MPCIQEGRAILAEETVDSFEREMKSKHIVASILRISHTTLLPAKPTDTKKDVVRQDSLVYRQTESTGPLPVILAGNPGSFADLNQSEIMSQTESESPYSAYTSIALITRSETGKRIVIGKRTGICYDFSFPVLTSLHVEEHNVLSVTLKGEFIDDPHSYVTAWSIVCIGFRVKQNTRDQLYGSVNVCIPAPK